MKYLKYSLNQGKKIIKGMSILLLRSIVFIFFFLVIIADTISDYTGTSFNPNDYCNFLSTVEDD